MSFDSVLTFPLMGNRSSLAHPKLFSVVRSDTVVRNGYFGGLKIPVIDFKLGFDLATS